MYFHATDFTVSIALLMALTVFIAGIRFRKPLENSWPMFYWFLVTALTVTRPGETFEFPVIAGGLVAGLLLRFEFMNRPFTLFVMLVEILVWGYVLFASLKIVLTR